MIYLLTNDGQTLIIHYSTIHALELIYFESNTQEMMKKQLYPSDSFNFPALKNPANIFDYHRHLHLTFIMRKNNITPSNVKETWEG